MTEINEDFYCTLSWTPEDCPTCIGLPKDCDRLNCGCRKRKFPSPAQYAEEHGREWPEDGAVYLNAWFVDEGEEEPMYLSGCYHVMRLMDVKEEIKNIRPDVKIAVICACTPWGCPPDDWRPKG